MSSPPDKWTEHKAPDGRTYYFNGAKNQSSWEKPDELKTETERLLSQCPWKEYTSESGKVYFHNKETQESVWTMPKELKELKEKVEKEVCMVKIKVLTNVRTTRVNIVITTGLCVGRPSGSIILKLTRWYVFFNPILDCSWKC